jgi:hypothetical protein
VTTTGSRPPESAAEFDTAGSAKLTEIIIMAPAATAAANPLNDIPLSSMRKTNKVLESRIIRDD